MIRLYEEILSITKSYMGIAAEHFVKRRCKLDLSIDDPAKIEPVHLDTLATGIGRTAEVYMEPSKGREFRREILDLKEKYQQHG